jgi:uncharacterized protein (TIGR02145 family)
VIRFRRLPILPHGSGYYNNDPSTAATYGKLYNWYAVNDPRGLAPKGWHVSTDSEWQSLSNCAGGQWYAGIALKEAGTAHWMSWFSTQSEVTNSTGFTALPAGGRISIGSSVPQKGYAVWWTNKDYYFGSSSAGVYSMNYREQVLQSDSYDKYCGFSVRCVKD